jgi:hypothetical protein
VVLLGDADVRHAVEDPLDADPRLHARERPAGAAVHPEAEGEVVAGAGAVDAELGRCIEVARIAVGCPVEHHHRRAGRHVDPADGGVAPGQPEVALHR